MITREYLEARIVEFTAARDKHQLDLEANNGALQLCRHLLASLAADADVAEAAAEEAGVEEVAAQSESAKANGEASAP